MGSVPSSIPRMIGRASPSQRSRSGNPDPKSIPKSRCSSSNHAPPMPRMARPPEMWSSVVAIFATSAGLRNGLAPTMRPTRACFVACAQAVIVSQPSKLGPCESPTMG